MEELKEVKKRGRKPNALKAIANPIPIGEGIENELTDANGLTGPTGPESDTRQRKRGRKKKYVIESISTLNEGVGLINLDSLSFDESDNKVSEIQNAENKTQVSFGSLNITIHKDAPVDKVELRKLFDQELKVENQVPYILTQEEKEIKVKEQFNFYKIKDSTSDTTNLYCHWCCHEFNNVPIPCPIKYNDITNEFISKGIFCSWECVTAYSIDSYKNKTLVYLMKKALTSSTDIDLKVALPRLCLKKFGGNMSIEEYREKSKIKLNNITIQYDKILQLNQYILEEMC